MAQRYARLLGTLQKELARELGEPVAFHLQLLKRFNRDEETLKRGDVDLMVLSAVDFLRAERSAPAVIALARESNTREGVIFARTNSGIQTLPDLKGKTTAFSEPNQSLSVGAKSLLFEAGIRGSESSTIVVTNDGILEVVLRHGADAGVTHRAEFERHRHLGLVALGRFVETPYVLAARAGLEPRIAEALRTALRPSEGGQISPEAKFVSNGETAALLTALRSALRNAEDFDKTPQVTHR